MNSKLEKKCAIFHVCTCTTFHVLMTGWWEASRVHHAWNLSMQLYLHRMIQISILEKSIAYCLCDHFFLRTFFLATLHSGCLNIFCTKLLYGDWNPKYSNQYFFTRQNGEKFVCKITAFISWQLSLLLLIFTLINYYYYYEYYDH